MGGGRPRLILQGPIQARPVLRLLFDFTAS